MPIDMSFAPWRSKFVYGPVGSETVLVVSLPARPWDRETGTVGGRRIAAAGTPASYIVRRDHVLMLPIRFYESEWTAVHSMIAWGQGSESILWYPDANVTAESYTVWLESPEAGGKIAPTRSDYPRVLEMTLALRSYSGSPWDLVYHDA